ncbi:hypothetical protein BDR03DRAFT_986205 [Suillus americanus]|nr:hypothetical protein BDR03DRAFT_986205 [Suillus americanus]
MYYVMNKPQVFNALTAIGLWLLRKQQMLAGLALSNKTNSPRRVPPETGHGDMSFWHAIYCVVGLGILALCGFYYWLWIVFLPWLGGYAIMEEVEQLEGSTLTAWLTCRYHSQDLLSTQSTHKLGSLNGGVGEQLKGQSTAREHKDF